MANPSLLEMLLTELYTPLEVLFDGLSSLVVFRIPSNSDFWDSFWLEK